MGPRTAEGFLIDKCDSKNTVPARAPGMSPGDARTRSAHVPIKRVRGTSRTQPAWVPEFLLKACDVLGFVYLISIS